MSGVTSERTSHTGRLIAFSEDGRVLAVAHPTDLQPPGYTGQWRVLPPTAPAEGRAPVMGVIFATADGTANARRADGTSLSDSPSPEAALSWMVDL